jgi:transcriptional regulator with XRE-family HTH domain
MDMRRLVGRNIARVRREKGLTQEQVAERSGISQQYLSGLERGNRNPSIVTLYEIAQALGVSHVDLVLPDGPDNQPGARQPSVAVISKSK